MTLEIGFLFALMAGAVALFVSEKVSFDVTALMVTGILMVSGILTVKEGLSGFSNQATVTIGAMFILSAGFRQAGVLRALGAFFSRIAAGGSRQGFLIILLVVGGISAFINNTAAVAIFIPVFIGLSRTLGRSPSRLLMPLSFISIFGGACTLIGTSTNILIASIALDAGLEKFSMFEFAPMGLIFMAAGFVYMFLYGNRKIPDYGPKADLTDQYGMGNYLYDLELTDECQHQGKPLEECILTDDIDLDVLRVFRGRESESAARSRSDLRKGDVLRTRGSQREVGKLSDRDRLRIRPPREWKDSDLVQGRDVLVEVSVAPDSGLAGKTLKSADLKRNYGAVVLAMRHQGKLLHENFQDVRLAGGDSLLLSIEHNRIPHLEESPDFIVISRAELKAYSRGRMAVAVSVLAGVIATAALNILPIVVSAMLGCLVLLLTGTITTRQAYNAIQWKVIFLLAGILPLGIAMSNTGADRLLADWVLSTLRPLGPNAVLSGFFLLAIIMTNIVSNQASAVLLAPIMITTANSMSLNPRTFLFALAFASSLSFATPVGYQTNTMIYNAGRYTFRDFTRVGIPLSILLWLVGSLLIPVIWPM
ncbi:MAG: SLC13 family permease [Candidatus Aegiribacteria sp.]